MGSHWVIAIAGLLLFVCSAEALDTIDVHEAKDLLNIGDYWYLDVRTQEEFNQSHIDMKKIVNIPYKFKNAEGNFIDNPKFLKQVSFTFKKDTPLIVGCQSGKRSLPAATELENSGFKNVKNMEGGFTAWVESGYPVKKPQNGTSTEEVVTIDVHEAKDLLNTGAYWYLDVRTREEFKQGHADVKKIMNIPYMFKTLEGNFTKNPQFVNQVSSIFKKYVPLIVGCQVGTRSLPAATDLHNSGFKNVTNMGGGYGAWVENGYPVKKPHHGKPKNHA